MHESEMKSTAKRRNTLVTAYPNLKDLGNNELTIAIPLQIEKAEIISKLSNGNLNISTSSSHEMFIYDILHGTWKLISTSNFDFNYKIKSAHKGIFVVERRK